jgi:hypothetical protein
MAKRTPQPVGSEELKDDILQMIVDKFDGRAISWVAATKGLALAAFEVNQMARCGAGRMAAGRARPSVT